MSRIIESLPFRAVQAPAGMKSVQPGADLRKLRYMRCLSVLYILYLKRPRKLRQAECLSAGQRIIIQK